MEQDDTFLDDLAPVRARMNELAELGNELEAKGRFDDAVEAWQEGLSLIPEPQQFYSETIWFLAAIGDVYFQKGLYPQAHRCFDQARGNLSGEGYANPFIMLRLGECALEIGDEPNALEYLLRAYMLDGEDIFAPDDGVDSDGKYFDYLKTHIDLSSGAR